MWIWIILLGAVGFVIISTALVAGALIGSGQYNSPLDESTPLVKFPD